MPHENHLEEKMQHDVAFNQHIKLLTSKRRERNMKKLHLHPMSIHLSSIAIQNSHDVKTIETDLTLAKNSTGAPHHSDHTWRREKRDTNDP